MNTNDCIYAAGLIDGEGSICLSKNNKGDKYRFPSVSVTSTSPELLSFLKDIFGGCISHQRVYKEHYKPSWVWAVRSDAAILCIEQIIPYMKEERKIARCNLILDQYKSLTVRNGRYNPEQHRAKLAFEEAFLAT